GKTVYVEKPLAISEEELNEVIEVAEESNGRIMVGFNRRFSSLSSELKKFFRNAGPLAITYRVNAGEIPKESWIRQAEGGGRIVGEVCHFVDYLQFLTDAEPVEVFAFGHSSSADTLSVVIKFSDGSVGNINYFATGDRAFGEEGIEVYGGSGVAILEDFRILEMWRDGKRRAIRRTRQDKGFDQELSSFLQAVRRNGEMPIAWRSILLTTLTTFRLEDALRSGQPKEVKLSAEY